MGDTILEGWRSVCPWPGTSFKESGRGFRTKDLDMGARIQDTVLQKKKQN
jgi:hypothetical protein